VENLERLYRIFGHRAPNQTQTNIHSQPTSTDLSSQHDVDDAEEHVNAVVTDETAPSPAIFPPYVISSL
jgi:hypothetical protein